MTKPQIIREVLFILGAAAAMITVVSMYLAVFAAFLAVFIGVPVFMVSAGWSAGTELFQ